MKHARTFKIIILVTCLMQGFAYNKAYCMNDDIGAAAAIGTYSGQALNALIINFFKQATGGSSFDQMIQKIVIKLNQMDMSPGWEQLKAMAKRNQTYLIKQSFYGCILFALASSIVSGIGYATYYGWLYGSEILAKYILMRMEKPRIIINSSAQERPNYIKRLYNFILRKKPDYDEMIFAPHTAQQLDDITKQTINIYNAIHSGKQNITYRNLLLEGLPGTGKTMFARQLARKSGLEWVELTGSSFFTKGAGIAAIDELFEWANANKKGHLIFIDEADSLFPDRSTMDANSENYKIINHFLNHLGTKSNKFMVVMSTNHKIKFDKAMRRRIHDYVSFPLPAFEQRVQLLKCYAEKTLFNEQLNGKAFAVDAQAALPESKMQQIASETEGFSSDEIATLIETIKSLSDISDEQTVTAALVDRAVQRQIEGRKELGEPAAITAH